MKNFIRRVLKRFIVFLHTKKGVTISPGCNIAGDVLLQPGVMNGVSGKLSIGKNCEISKGAVIKCYGGNVKIDQHVFIGEYVTIYGHGNVDIGENTLIAMHTCIVTSNHTIPDKKTLIRSQPDLLSPVKIGKDVWLGAGVKVLRGVTIGDGCVVGAGALVTKDLLPYSISTGIPAKVISYRND